MNYSKPDNKISNKPDDVRIVYKNMHLRPNNHIMPNDFHPDFNVHGTGMNPAEWESFANSYKK